MYWKLTRCRHQGCNLKSLGTPLSGYVRFGSKADMCNAKRHVRFTPNSDRESRHDANGHVRFHNLFVQRMSVVHPYAENYNEYCDKYERFQ
jgi:hypothetical protein